MKKLFLELSINKDLVSYTFYRTTNNDPIIMFKGSFEAPNQLLQPTAALSYIKDPVLIDLTDHRVATSHKTSIDLANPTDSLSQTIDFLAKKIVSFYTDLITFDPEA